MVSAERRVPWRSSACLALLVLCALPLAAVAQQGGARQGGGPQGPARQGGGGGLAVTHVQGNVHLISGAGVNVTVQVGRYGVTLVDTPDPARVPDVLAEVRRLSPLAVRYILNTSVSEAYMGGTAALIGASTRGGRRGGAPFGFVGLNRPSVIAQENVLNRLSALPDTPVDALPTTTYYLPTMDFSNSEAIVVYHAPAAHTDSDSIVLFRGSDVISTGALFTPGRYPEIDIARGGSVDGLAAALTQVLALAVPEGFASGGTRIVPGVGRICEETDVAEYRDMLVIIKERIEDMRRKGMSVEQVKAERPSRDYDAEYGASQAEADRFVETIYRSLTQQAGGRS
ncbi:MAG: hypothetical protein AB7G23_09265 [Vicinamibacterales bacterium]